ncbi:MAG: hypothetical protein D6706_14810 [Chloroflexi bacterium]|nr:MAG: hypothetical protein D6706_14810 [Chloroflexota bacterium]
MRHITYVIVLVCLVMGVYWQTAVSMSSNQPPTPILLSDQTQTEGDVFTFSFGSTNNIYWFEQNTTSSEGLDLFFSTPPYTQTVRLSDLTQTEGSANYMHTLSATADDGTPHLIWLEDTGTSEEYDLFYWNPISGTLRLTDQSITEGSPSLSQVQMNIQLDQNNQAHVIWNEIGNDGLTTLWFYWSQATNQTQQISGINPGFLPAMAIQGTTVHLVWNDYNDNSLHYWNSADKTILDIPGTAWVAAGIGAFIPDSSGNMLLYWYETSTQNCLNRWNATTQTVETLVSSAQSDCISALNFEQDNSGKLHAAMLIGQFSQPNLYYWNSTLSNPILIQSLTGVSPKYWTHVDKNGVFHIVWLSPAPSESLYYWNSTDQSVVNLSAGFGSGTYVSEYTVNVFYPNNKLYISWSEDNAFHIWQPGGTIENLNTKFGMSGITLPAMRADSQGNLFMAWHGTPTSGSEGLFVWDEVSNTVQQVFTGTPVNTYFLSFSVTPAGTPYLAWASSNQAYYWNESVGTINLTVNALPDFENVYVSIDSDGNVNLTWLETSSTAGEGSDIYAAWIPAPVLSHSVYLPAIQK